MEQPTTQLEPDEQPDQPVPGDEIREEIAREQERVDASYVALERARERAERSVERAIAAPVSTPQSQFEKEAELDRSLRRLKALTTSERQLVFGRLDMEDTADPVYVGRVGLGDERRNRILVDWRAPVGSTYYRATAANPRGVIRRRTLVTKGRDVTEINDDLLIPDKAKDFHVVVGEGALLRSLERERGPYMQDILATIQGEQDEIIRDDPRANVVLTGGPGTGKSVVALHRTAYLMFERAEELERRGVLFVGPTARFSKYISRVLPSLGETAVQIRSVFDLTHPQVAESREPLETGRLKGRLEMAKVIRTLVTETYPAITEPLRLRTGNWSLDLSVREIARLREETLRGIREGMNRAQDPFLRLLARRLLQSEGPGARTDRKAVAAVAEEVGSETDVEALVDAVLPIRDAATAWAEIRADERAILRAAARVFSAADAGLIAADLADDQTRVGDLPLMDEVRTLLGDPPVRTDLADPDDAESYAGGLFSFQDELDRGRQQTAASAKRAGFGHIVVDEAQDLTPMQWRSLARLGPYATWNIVGDPKQATLATPDEMESSIAGLPGGNRAHRYELAINYRTPAEIMAYASKLSGLDLGGLRSIRHANREPEVFAFDVASDDAAAAAQALGEALRATGGGAGSRVVVAMVAEDLPLAESVVAAGGETSGNVDILTAVDAKGLEFDHVILFRPERLLPVRSHSDASLLLIAATRATQTLTVVSAAS